MTDEGLKKLLDDTSPENVRKADALLRRGALLFADERNGTVGAVFAAASKEGAFVRTEVAFENGTPMPSCGCSADNAPCEHAAALAKHLLSFSATRADAKRQQPPFNGLTAASSSKSAAKRKRDARLELRFSHLPPHAPSKWEKVRLSLAMFAEGKRYVGNPSNLRQLAFGKGLGATLDLERFSSQDRQIIRFLATHAEKDAKEIILPAEVAADFLHCLVGSESCFFDMDGVSAPKSAHATAPLDPVTFHAAPAEFAVNVISTPKRPMRLSLALVTEIGVLPLRSFTMVFGTSGLWVGMDLDYWWIPGNRDMTTLRQMMLSKPSRMSAEETDEFLRLAEFEGVRIIRGASVNSPRVGGCVPFYDARMNQGDLELDLSFQYADVVVGTGAGHLQTTGKRVWRRDGKRERSLAAELLAMGFRKPSPGPAGRYLLKSTEAVGEFLLKTVPAWVSDGKEMAISTGFAKLLGIGEGGIELSVHNVDDSKNPVQMEISFTAASKTLDISWNALRRLVAKGGRYVSTVENGRLAEVPPELARFVEATKDFTKSSDNAPGVVSIPRSALPYWGRVFESCFGVMPDAARRMVDAMPDSGRDRRKSASSPSGGDNPFKGRLRKYQREGVEWLDAMFANNLNAVLADEMGLGKTIQTLALLCAAKTAEPNALTPSLVLCPSSLVDNWLLEAGKFAPSLSTLVLRGPNRARALKRVEDADIVITSYATASRDVETLRKTQFKYLVLDEAQHIKNPSTLNASTAKSLKAERKLVLTGTPMENAPVEFWSIFDFLHPGLLGSLNAFKTRYAGIASSEKMQLDLAARTAPFILRRKKRDVEPDLPEKSVQTLFCEMSPSQKQLYERCREDGLEHLRRLAKKGGGSRFDILTNLLRLRQICCHPSLVPGVAESEPDVASAKTELLKELLLGSIDSGHKVLVFSQFTSFLNILRGWLEERSIPFEYLDGSTSNRQERVDAFNANPETRLFLLSLKAGGVGLNLTSADRVIIYDPWWNPAVEDQATDRTHRIGQTRKVLAMKLVVKDSVEEKILKLQKRKQRVFRNLVDTPSATLKSLSDEDLEFLMT